MIRLLRLGWERLSLYLPVALMGLLALGTYWLVRSTPQWLPPARQLPLRHEPDYFMRGFSVKTFDPAGRLKSEILGADARHYPDTDTLEVESVRMRSFDQEGRVTLASARRAVAKGDASEVQLFGDARVVRASTPDKDIESPTRIEFSGEFLHAFIATERVTSDRPVALNHGYDQFTADALDFDNLARVVLLKGRVKATLRPHGGQ